MRPFTIEEARTRAEEILEMVAERKAEGCELSKPRERVGELMRDFVRACARNMCEHASDCAEWIDQAMVASESEDDED